jgi:beta-phosphoglucomutase-like phosphatase (HAD superfamily)
MNMIPGEDRIDRYSGDHPDMRRKVRVPEHTDSGLTGIEVVLCDADGNLFPSEEPAFVASTTVTNRLLRHYGADRSFTPEELRLATTGKNFRATLLDLAVAHGVPTGPDLAASTAAPAVLDAAAREHWVAEERRVVTDYLRSHLAPDPQVSEPLRRLSRHFTLAIVSSSATPRVAACLEVTGLAPFFPAERCFSAEDSLPLPTSKPDPAIYTFAGKALGITPEQGLAIEDSIPGAQAAVAANFRTIGNVLFVPEGERAARIAALRDVGVIGIISSWWELVELLIGAGEGGRATAAEER